LILETRPEPNDWAVEAVTVSGASPSLGVTVRTGTNPVSGTSMALTLTDVLKTFPVLSHACSTKWCGPGFRDTYVSTLVVEFFEKRTLST
jgi:hypothetical protein